ELQRHRQLRDDRVRDGERPLVLAEITPQRMDEPADVLDGQRLVEPVVVADLGDYVRVAVLAAERDGRIARQRPDPEEDEEARNEQDDQGGSGLSQNEAAHDLLRVSALLACEGDADQAVAEYLDTRDLLADTRVVDRVPEVDQRPVLLDDLESLVVGRLARRDLSRGPSTVHKPVDRLVRVAAVVQRAARVDEAVRRPVGIDASREADGEHVELTSVGPVERRRELG